MFLRMGAYTVYCGRLYIHYVNTWYGSNQFPGEFIKSCIYKYLCYLISPFLKSIQDSNSVFPWKNYSPFIIFFQYRSICISKSLISRLGLTLGRETRLQERGVGSIKSSAPLTFSPKPFLPLFPIRLGRFCFLFVFIG